jgi:hypothetical protein
MSVTLKAVDYAVKACGSTPVDYAAHVAPELEKLEGLRNSFLAVCRESRAGKEIAEDQLNLLETVVAIFADLCNISERAFDSALHASVARSNDSCRRLQNLRLLGESLTRSVRLCVASLFTGQTIYAASAVREVKEGSELFEKCEARRSVGDPNHCRQQWREQAIASNFEDMTKSLHRVTARLIEAEQAAAAMLSRSLKNPAEATCVGRIVR